ncbi:MAG: hypothetical protein L0241_05910, partial [Planctomycetia bacterium]|nr:hypothetical protein [Planctomycetia bacterium]
MVFAFLLLALAWVGHACIWTALLNNLYGRPLSKSLLKLWRFVTGGIILSFPLLLWSVRNEPVIVLGPTEDHASVWGLVIYVYAILCLAFSVIIFLPLTIERALRKRPACLVEE